MPLSVLQTEIGLSPCEIAAGSNGGTALQQGWPPRSAAGRWWLLLTAAGCFWLPLAAEAEVAACTNSFRSAAVHRRAWPSRKHVHPAEIHSYSQTEELMTVSRMHQRCHHGGEYS